MHSNLDENISFKIRNTLGIVFNPIRVKTFKLHCFLIKLRSVISKDGTCWWKGEVHNFGSVLILPSVGQARAVVLQGGLGCMRSHEKA